jgi:type II secretory pathway pseudopilin PulG
MELGSLLAYFSTLQFGIIVAALLLIVLVLVVVALQASRRQVTVQLELKQRLETLWHEMDELRVQQFNASEPSVGNSGNQVLAEQFLLEKAALEKIWPLVWGLHDKLASFLRAVESNEPTGDTRVTARNAALEARKAVNGLRPFFNAEVDDLLTRLIDTEIKAHLAACQYMDMQQGGLSAGAEDESSRHTSRQKFRLLHEGDAKDLLNHLVEVMRRRMVGK